MKRRSRRRSGWRRGLTLVEVVAGTALVGALLTALILAHAGQLKQARRAERRLEAVAAADALLRRWHGPDESVPPRGEGPLPGDGGLVWRTSPTRNLPAERLGLAVVLLEILDGRSGVALCSVELPVAAEREGQ